MNRIGVMAVVLHIRLAIRLRHKVTIGQKRSQATHFLQTKPFSQVHNKVQTKPFPRDYPLVHYPGYTYSATADCRYEAR
jgi:hypothetical protein